MSDGIKTQDTSRRLGRVTVADKVLRESINNGSAARIFYGSVPLEVERDWMRQASTYVLWHPSFADVEEGARIPRYVAVLENGAIHWEQDEPTTLEALAEEVRKHGDERLASMAIAALASNGGAR